MIAEDALDASRIYSLTIWFALAWAFWPSVRSYCSKARIKCERDPGRVAIFCLAFIINGFSLRWFLAPDSMLTWIMLNLACGTLALFIILQARADGRGPPV